LRTFSLSFETVFASLQLLVRFRRLRPGNIIADGQTAVTTTPLISLSAGFCIALTVVALNLLGDGLRDTLDPQMQRQTGVKML